MNITKTLTSLVVGASAIFGTIPEVNASPVHDRIVSQVKALGVEIIDAGDWKMCQKNPDESFTLGGYDRKDNVMVFCTNNFKSEEELYQTLAHEAVHVAQDCKTGINTFTNAPLGNWKSLVPHLTDKDASIIVNFYEKDKWGIETEAFYLMYRPSSVSGLLQKYCF